MPRESAVSEESSPTRPPARSERSADLHGPAAELEECGPRLLASTSARSARTRSRGRRRLSPGRSARAPAPSARGCRRGRRARRRRSVGGLGATVLQEPAKRSSGGSLPIRPGRRRSCTRARVTPRDPLERLLHDVLEPEEPLAPRHVMGLEGPEAGVGELLLHERMEAATAEVLVPEQLRHVHVEDRVEAVALDRDEHPARPEHAPVLGQRGGRVLHVVERVLRVHHVEGRVLERKPLPVGDPELSPGSSASPSEASTSTATTSRTRRPRTRATPAVRRTRRRAVSRRRGT